VKSKPKDDKAASLSLSGTLNAKSGAITDELFNGDKAFFDPRDLVQVKYEMLRRVDNGESSVSKASGDFGFSRPSFYEAKRLFDADGVAGLVPKTRGPKSPHKLTDEILDFISSIGAAAGNAAEVAALIKKQFEIDVHPRSIARAVSSRQKKKGPQKKVKK
jgi:transposase